MHARDVYGRTALTWACLFNRVKAAEVLLKHGANTNERDKNGDPILCLCAASGLDDRWIDDSMFAHPRSLNEHILELLMTHDLDLRATRESNGDTALHVALRSGTAHPIQGRNPHATRVGCVYKTWTGRNRRIASTRTGSHATCTCTFTHSTAHPIQGQNTPRDSGRVCV